MFKKLGLGLFALIIIGTIIYYGIGSATPKTQMNKGYVNGNTAGNLYNGGLFCESDGTIFFSNPSDGGKLYSMDSNGQNLKKLSNDAELNVILKYSVKRSVFLCKLSLS